MSEIKELPSYYAIIPAVVRYDRRLKANEKLLFGEITCLTNARGYCAANNEYFAKLYDVHKNTASLWINNLIDCGYLHVELLYSAKNEFVMRKLWIAADMGINEKNEGVSRKTRLGYHEKAEVGITKKLKKNNTSYNNTSSNNTSSACAVSFEKVQEKNEGKKSDLMTYLPANVSRETWQDWIAFRSERKKALTETAAKMQKKALEAMQDPEFSIKNSINNGWTGLFESTKKGNSSPEVPKKYNENQGLEMKRAEIKNFTLLNNLSIDS